MPLAALRSVLECAPCRRCGRVVDCTGLENRQGATLREFESHRLRQMGFVDGGSAVQDGGSRRRSGDRHVLRRSTGPDVARPGQGVPSAGRRSRWRECRRQARCCGWRRVWCVQAIPSRGFRRLGCAHPPGSAGAITDSASRPRSLSRFYARGMFSPARGWFIILELSFLFW